MSKRIPLTQGKFAIVDDEDYACLHKYKWYAARGGNTYYAVRTVKTQTHPKYMLRMHRLLLGVGDPKQQIDHINRNGLDNRKCNLRLVDVREQRMNTKIRSDNKSGFTGVYLDKKSGRWRANHAFYGKTIHIGMFDTPEEAAQVRARLLEKLDNQRLDNFNPALDARLVDTAHDLLRVVYLLAKTETDLDLVIELAHKAYDKAVGG